MRTELGQHPVGFMRSELGQHPVGFRMRSELGQHPRVLRWFPAGLEEGRAAGWQRWHLAGGSGPGFLWDERWGWRSFPSSFQTRAHPSSQTGESWPVVQEPEQCQRRGRALGMHGEKSIHPLAPSGTLFELSRTAPGSLSPPVSPLCPGLPPRW